MSDKPINMDEFNQARRDRDSWRNAWYEANSIGGKMWWDGANYGYTQGLKAAGSAPYGIDKRAPEIAKSVSILIDAYITAHLDVGLEVSKTDPVMADMVPLTFFVVRYNTGDQILFQYVDGKQRVARIKTHDGLFVDEDGIITRSPQSELFKKER